MKTDRFTTRLTVLSLVLALALALTACGGGAGDDALTVMGRRSDMEKSYMTAIFGLYQETTGKKLNLKSYEDSEFEEKAAELFAQGKGPDILLHFHNTDLDRFNVSENFLTLTDQPWVPDLAPGALAYCQNGDGDLLGLPFWESSVSGCYYNKTVLDSLGLQPAATQAEFDMLCQTLREAGKTPICWPADGCTWMFQFGLDPIFADDPALLTGLNDGSLTYADIPAVTDMAAWIDTAARSGWFGDDYMRTGWDGISEDLSSGGAVMTFIWDTWFYTDFTPGKYTVEDFALMPVFMGTADRGTYEGGNLNMMMVNKNSPRMEEALEFLSFCAAPENYNAAFDGIATVPCFNGMTGNIQSQMVRDASASVSAFERVSTAATRIVGYSAEDVAAAVNEMLRGKLTPASCVAQMDAYRLEDAVKQGASPGSAE